jgi:glycosyltransferase involved in cell wall biosynthesis
MKVFALVDAPDHVCCRYRIRAFELALGSAGWSLTLRGLARGTLARFAQITEAARFESVILQRKLLPAWQFLELRRRARHLVFDFDDAVLYRDSFDPRGPRCARRARRFARTVRKADVVIAGNDFLADCALRAGAKAERVRVIPTCVETSRYRPAAPTPSSDSGLELVWIGSSSTLQGLEKRRSLWERIAAEVPGVRLRVICDRFPDLGAMPLIRVPWSETTEASELAAAHAGISWIPDDVWSRGKCGLKVLQYLAAGLPVIANRVGVQTEMIVPGVTGLLADTDDEWVDAVRRLAADAMWRTHLGTAGRAAVERGYSVSAWAETFVGSVTGPALAPALSATGKRRSGNRGARPHLDVPRRPYPKELKRG